MLMQPTPDLVKRCGLLLLTALALFSCNSGSSDNNNKVTGPAAAVQTTTYQGMGVVKGTDAKRPSIDIDHQEIKGLMPAMRMEFYVKDKSLLEGLQLGDQVEFTIENGVGGEKIIAIRRL